MPAVGNLAQEIVSKVSLRNPTSVLFVEDDDGDAIPIESRFRGKRYRFFRARNPIEATQLLDSREFDYAVVDHYLGAGFQSGTNWIYENLRSLRGTRVRVLTGLPENVEHRSELEEAGVKVVAKAKSDAEDVIWKPLREFAEKRVSNALEDLAKSVESPSSDSVGEISDASLGEELSREMVAMFECWLDKFSEPDKPILLLGDDSYTPSEIKEGARSGAGYGARIKKRFIRQAWKRMGLERKLD